MAAASSPSVSIVLYAATAFPLWLSLRHCCFPCTGSSSPTRVHVARRAVHCRKVVAQRPGTAPCRIGSPLYPAAAASTPSCSSSNTYGILTITVVIVSS
nr:unnamed protein product [Digitaria exilis]